MILNITPPHSFNTILIGAAFSPNLKNNILEAKKMVDFFGSTLVIVHVGEKTEKKSATLKNLLSDYYADVQIVWQQGNPVNVILSAAKKYRADLIMLGAIPTENLLRFYIGSIARKITRKAPCSVLLMIHPSGEFRPFQHIVVNDLDNHESSCSISTSVEIANSLGSQQLTIVEEITPEEVHIVVEDDKSLRKDMLIKEQLTQQRELRVKQLLNQVPEEIKKGIKVKTQPIFGKRGYSIGHYAKVVGADLLIMNAPKKTSLWDRIFPHDLEYILSELPTDVLIMR